MNASYDNLYYPLVTFNRLYTPLNGKVWKMSEKTQEEKPQREEPQEEKPQKEKPQHEAPVEERLTEKKPW
jgi:hypothetical protein